MISSRDQVTYNKICQKTVLKTILDKYDGKDLNKFKTWIKYLKVA